jgi:hypothetical protein
VVGRIVQRRAPQERDIAASPARSKHLNGNWEGGRIRNCSSNWSDSFRMFFEESSRRMSSYGMTAIGKAVTRRVRGPVARMQCALCTSRREHDASWVNGDFRIWHQTDVGRARFDVCYRMYSVVRVAPPPIDKNRCAPRIRCGAGLSRITR